MLESGGSYWFGYDYDNNWQSLEYGKVTLETGGALAEDIYEYDFESRQWQPGYEDGDYLLTGSGWAKGIDGAAGGTIVFYPDGSAVWTDKVDGAQSRLTVVEVDLTGKKMRSLRRSARHPPQRSRGHLPRRCQGLENDLR